MSDIAQLNIEVKTIGAESAADKLNKVADAGKSTESAVSSLSSGLQALAGSWLVGEMVTAGMQLVNLGAKYEMLGATMTIMANNTGRYRAEFDEIQASVEKTGISMLRARQSIQIMAAAQLDMSKTSELARVAQDGATLAGINSSEAFQKLVQGITTGEARIIRHMGIMVNFKTALDKYAHATNQNVMALSEEEKMRVRLKAVLDEGSKRLGVYEAAMTTAGKQMLSMVRYTENLQVQLGEVFNPTTNAVVFELVGLMHKASERMKEWKASGEMGLFASNLKQEIMTAVGWFEKMVTTLYELRAPIEVFAAAWAGLKIGSWLNEVWLGLDSLKNKFLEQRAIIIADAQLKIDMSLGVTAQETRAHVIKMRILQEEAVGELQALALQAQTTKGGYWKTEMYEAVALAAQNAARATQALAVAEAEELLATEALTSAKAAQAGMNEVLLSGQAALNTAQMAAGSWIAIVAIGLTTLISLYQLFKDTKKQDEIDSDRMHKESMQRLDEEIERQAKLYDMLKNGKKPDEKEPAAKDPEERRLETLARKVRDEALAVRKETEELRAASLSMMGDDTTIFAEIANNDKRLLELEARFKELTKQQDEYNKKRAEADAAAKKAEDERIRQRKKEEAAKELIEHQLFTKKQIADMEEKISEAGMKGYGMDKLAVELNKIKAESVKKIIGYQEKYNEINKSTGQRGLTKAQLDSLTAEAKKLELAQLSAARREHEYEIYQKMTEELYKLTKNNEDFGKSFEDIQYDAQRGYLSELATDIEEAGARERILTQARENAIAISNAYWEGQKNINLELRVYEENMRKLNEAYDHGAVSASKYAEESFKLRDALSGGMISGNMTPQEKFAHDMEIANLRLKDNLTNTVSYNREQIKLAMGSGSAWAGMAQVVSSSVDTVSGALADFFNGTAFSWHDMFSKMARDMEIAIIKATLMKPVMDGLAASIASLTSGTNLTMWEAFLSASGFGKLFGGQGDAPNLPDSTSGEMNFPGFATGGNISGPAIVGERGPELFIPSSSGTIIPNNALGGGTFNIQINLSGDGSSSEKSGGSTDMASIGNILAGRVREVIMDEQRPNGILYNFVHGR